MTLLSRSSLLAKEKIEIVEVDLGKDEKGDPQSVFVRQMSGRERDVWERSFVKEIKDNKGTVIGHDQAFEDFRAKLAVVTVCNSEGMLILKPSDAPILSQNMSAATLEKIVNAAQRLNAITEEDKEAIVKNSEADQVGNSSSDSA